MRTNNLFKTASVVAPKRPLLILGTAYLAQVAGGGPNGGWSAATAVQVPAGGSLSRTSGPTTCGPNGGW